MAGVSRLLLLLSGSCCMASTVRRREMTLRMKEKDIARGRGLPMAENWYLRAGVETTGFRGHLARRRAMTNA